MPSKSQSIGGKGADWRIARWDKHSYPVKTTSRHKDNALDSWLLTPLDPPFPDVVGCYLDCWLSVLKAHSRQNSFSLVPVLLSSSFVFSVPVVACPVRSGPEPSRMPTGNYDTKEAAALFSTHTLCKQSSLSTQQYSKRQVPRKIRAS